jgi:hypothetical protein
VAGYLYKDNAADKGKGTDNEIHVLLIKNDEDDCDEDANAVQTLQATRNLRLTWWTTIDCNE